ncbi:hypothetical protein EMCRGX_G004281 [Ephydatia muelleri]
MGNGYSREDATADSKEYYQIQSRNVLGGAADVFWVQVDVDLDNQSENYVQERYSRNIEKALSEINRAAPGLFLSTRKIPALKRIYIVGKNINSAYTQGNIIEYDSAKVTLGSDFNLNTEKQTIVHELLHALGADHEHCRQDAHKHHLIKDCKGPNHNIDPSSGTALTRFDPMSITMYPIIPGALKRKPNDCDPIWLIKGNDDSAYNMELSELDKRSIDIAIDGAQYA